MGCAQSAREPGHAAGTATATTTTATATTGTATTGTELTPHSPLKSHYLLGVSVKFFQDFVQRLNTAFPGGWKSLTTAEICAKFVQPATEEAGTAYYLLFLDSNTSRHIQPATHFVSHAWKYTFSSVVDTLIQFGESHPGSYFWFDLFMNDQNNAANLPQEWWSTTFKEAIAGIGHTLLLFSPWNDPIPMTRAWCLFEMNHTIDSKTCKMSVLLPEKERQALKEAVIEDSDAAQKVLRDVDAERAEAFKEKDKKMIFDAVREHGGFHKLNSMIKAGMRDNILALVQEFVPEEEVGKDANEDRRKKYARVCLQVGRAMSDNGEHDKALFYYKKALEIREEVLGKKHLDTAISYASIGLVYEKKGDYDKALEYHLKALEIYEEVLGKKHPDTALSYNNIGVVYEKKGDYDKALEYYLKALEIQEEVLGKKHPDTAASYSNIGNVYNLKGDYDKALEYHLKAVEVFEEVLGKKHPHTAGSYNNIGVLYHYKSDYTKALDMLQKAEAIWEEVLGTGHPNTVTVKEWIAIVKSQLKNN